MDEMGNDFVKATCRPGRGADTCKYLMMSGAGWECAKITGMKAVIDVRDDMTAKGDNCPGWGVEC